MGLDTVELVMEIETAFDVRFSDTEAQSCRTVGDVFDLILAKSPGLRRNTGCLSGIAFYRLRRSCLPLLDAQRAEFRPRTALLRLIRQDDLPGVWSQLERLLGYRLPPLARDPCLDRWARRSSVWLVACIMSAIVAAAIDERLAVLFAISAAYSLLFCLGCMAAEYLLPVSELPDDITTVGDLARSIRWHYRNEADASARQALDAATNAAWDRLVAIICKELAVEKEQVTPEADIVRDLGAD